MKTKIFISYSHDDIKYVDDKEPISILKFIKGLENEINVEFWYDKKISTGELWNEEIQKNIKASKIAICLVSQNFIDSLYITKNEINEFLKKRKKEGMIIYPIILSDCDFDKHQWLKETQYIPRDNQNIELHYNSEGKRKELYTKIRKEIKSIISNMNCQNQPNESSLATGIVIPCLDNEPTVSKNVDVESDDSNIVCSSEKIKGYKFQFHIDMYGNFNDFSLSTTNAIRSWFYEEEIDTSFFENQDKDLKDTFSVEIIDERIEQTRKQFYEIKNRIKNKIEVSKEDDDLYIYYLSKIKMLIKEKK